MIVKNIIELNKLEVMQNNDNKLDNNEDERYKVVETKKEEKTEELRTSSGAFNILSNDKNGEFYYKPKK